MSFLDLSYSPMELDSEALLSSVSLPPPLVFPHSQFVIVHEIFLDASMRSPSQSYYWTKEWQEAEREAMEEFRRGEYVSFAGGSEAAQWLTAD